MSDMQPAIVQETTPGLTQLQRVTSIFTAPTKTFTEIRDGKRSWWLPFVIVTLCGFALWFAIAKQVTWKTVYENQMKQAPEYAQRMMEQMPPEKRAQAEAAGPRNQAVTWALAPAGLLIIQLLTALILWPTINFGFGGKAKYGSVLAVVVFAGLVRWPIRLLLAALALFAGATPDGFNISNPAPTNAAAFLNPAETSKVLYTLLMVLDPTVIWSLVLTGIGLSIVAGVKRGSGYIVTFGWWALISIFFIGLAAVTG